jgi:membrane-bound inhibitor of C-type lysozyme
MPNEMVGGVSKEIFDVLADVTKKAGNGTITLDELKRFAHRENPFVTGKLSKRQRQWWEGFYRSEFGLNVDLSTVVVPDGSGDFSSVIVVAQGITIEKVIAACRKHFKVRLYRDDLGNEVRENERTPTNGSYAIRVRERVEADEELKNLSANQIKERKLSTMTLLERLILELKYFKETGKHLDLENVTLCSGSRYSDGFVPGVYWRSAHDELGVGWGVPDDRDDGVRSRAVVS